MNRTEAVCHKWIYDNDNGSYDYNSYNMSYHGPKLYSYNTVLARIDRERNIICIDKSTAHCSHTSGRHYRYLLRAIPSYNYTVFTFPFHVDDKPAWYLEQCMFLLDKQSRARKSDYTTSIISHLDEALKYISMYKYDKRKSTYKQLMALDANRDDMLAQVADIIEADKKAKAAAKRKYDKQMQSKRQATLDRFTGGGVTFDPNYTGVYLRINDDKLQTTNSITVPLADATLLYKRWAVGKDILGANLDCYKVIQASSKSVQIGCTKISANELHRTFKELM